MKSNDRTLPPSSPPPAPSDFLDVLTARGPSTEAERFAVLRYAERVHRASAERFSGALRIVKRCACGCEYNAAAWSRLPYVGVMGDAVERIELRNCSCGSTLAIEIAAKGAA